MDIVTIVLGVLGYVFGLYAGITSPEGDVIVTPVIMGIIGAGIGWKLNKCFLKEMEMWSIVFIGYVSVQLLV